MGRGSFSLFRRKPSGPPPGAPAQTEEAPAEEHEARPADPGLPQSRRPPYHPGLLRRERRALARAREERIRDLGGLILEMFRRDRFREDLMREQAEEIFGMEARIQEIDGFLTMTRREVIQAGRCECGAPIVSGSHFCANCGRPTGEAVFTCASCGHPLPADARFCGNCGAAAPAPEPGAGEEAGAGAPPPEQGAADAEAPSEGQASDPWER